MLDRLLKHQKSCRGDNGGKGHGAAAGSGRNDRTPGRGGVVNRRPDGDRGDRGGRPPQSKPQSSSSPAAAIDPMEKSLRDINLRLKNAEREQENTRKKIQEGGSVGRDGFGSRDDSRSDRGERGDRNDRGGRGGSRDGRPPRREFNRDGGRPDRPPRREPPTGSFRREENAAGDVEPKTQEVIVTDVNVSEENLQHGRKFTAKRRPLTPTPENAGDTQASADEGRPTANDVVQNDVVRNDVVQNDVVQNDVVRDDVSNTSVDSNDSTDSASISYGR